MNWEYITTPQVAGMMKKVRVENNFSVRVSVRVWCVCIIIIMKLKQCRLAGTL